MPEIHTPRKKSGSLKSSVCQTLTDAPRVRWEVPAQGPDLSEVPLEGVADTFGRWKQSEASAADRHRQRGEEPAW